MPGTRPILAAVLILTPVAGCTSSSRSATESTTSTAATTAHPLPPGELGKYVRPANDDLSTALTLTADGRYTQKIPSGEIHGVWSFNNGRITFTELGGGDCTGQRGIYRWSYANKRLTLTIVSDPCVPRTEDFPSPPWRQRS
jgi:hypothetical protein